MSTSIFNRCWARVILETLIRQNVFHFCIAPGSRSTPLTLEANRLQERGRAICHTHFDERGLGFFALGLSKALNQRVAVIVTSGTATANLYPAIIEARQSGINLVILTADRPLELLECGANQAILQENMFANYPIATVNLPRPSEDYEASWLISIIDQACYKQELRAGVIHINIPFAEPLYEAKSEEIDFHPWLANIQRWLTLHKKWINHQNHQYEVLMHENWDQWRSRKGVVVVGRLPFSEAMGIKDWVTTMGWIMITDIQSSVEANLPYADVWLANETIKQKLLQADIVIQLGSGFISKRLHQYLSAFKNEYWIVDNSDNAIDPYHHSTVRFKAKIHHWLRAHPPLRQKSWLIEPLALSNFCTKFIEEEVSSNLNEASLAYYIGRILPKNSQLFLGNSLFVRLVDALAKLPEGYPVFTNRGASGIDGLFATISGISIGGEKITVALLGDISALYDLNSLALLKKVEQPTVVFIINNNGGAIFDMLPVEETIKDQYYRMPHNLEFSQIATMFDLKYARPYTWADLSSVLKTAYIRKEATIIEIKVNQNDGTNIYKRLIEQISYAVIGE